MIHVILIRTNSTWFFFESTYSYVLYDKKELDVYLRVPGNATRKTDFGRFGYHPIYDCEYALEFK